MKSARGFTVVELAIVIAIMAILLVLGVVSYRGYQSRVRDKEREADIASIQMYLESIYPQEIRNDSGVVIKPAGSYPGHYSHGSNLPVILQADFDKIFAELPDSVKKGPAQQEEFISAHSTLLLGTRQLNSLTDVNIAKVNYPAHIANFHPNGAYIYFSHNGSSRCYHRDGCRQYTILYHLENEPGVWKVAESKHK